MRRRKTCRLEDGWIGLDCDPTSWQCDVCTLRRLGELRPLMCMNENNSRQLWFYSMAALLRRGPQKVLGTAWYVLICLVYHCFYCCCCCCSNLEVLWLVVLAFFFTKVWTGLQRREFEQKWPPFTGVEMGWRSLYAFSVFPRPSSPCWSRVQLSTIASHLKFICRKSTWNKAWGSKKN